ncbi:MAG: C40 family peptidase, partial [Nitrococcus mobilis]|nr:C40 family peptidase [Nitrococcus mobilis]
MFDLSVPIDKDRLARALERRLRYVHRMLSTGRYTGGEVFDLPEALGRSAALAQSVDIKPALRTPTSAIDLRCTPQPGPLIKPGDPLRLDRNQCSRIRPGEPMQRLAPWDNGMELVRTYYGLGWIADGSKHSRWKGSAHNLWPSPTELTRAAVYERAFSLLGRPYGWGGTDGGLDCSLFIMEVFRELGILLPRHSSLQAQAPPLIFDVPAETPPSARLSLIEAAHRRGVTLLHLPGHIMLYLGTDAQGEAMAIHAFAEYKKPCPRAAHHTHTRVQVQRVEVSTLHLGERTTDGSLLS